MTDKTASVEKLRSRLPDSDPRLFDVFSAWLDARGENDIPFRRDFSPLSVPALLRYLFITRLQEDAGDFVFELAGESVNDAWGRNVKNLTLREVVGEEDFPAVRGRWNNVIGEPAFQYVAAERKMSSLDVWRAERLQMPMRSADGTVDVILGVSLYTLSTSEENQAADIPRLVRQFPCREIL